MQQCYSGGFIDNLTSGAHGRKTAIFTACGGNQLGWRADDVSPSPDAFENEPWGQGQFADHGEFDYYFMCALWCATPVVSASIGAVLPHTNPSFNTGSRRGSSAKPDGVLPSAR